MLGPPMSISSIRVPNAMSALAAALTNGYRFTTTTSIGVMLCWPRVAISSARLRRARMPPCTDGCSVFTRPSMISGKPVTAEMPVTRTPASSRARAVPPVDTSSYPRPASACANGNRPVLSETLIRALGIWLLGAERNQRVYHCRSSRRTQARNRAGGEERRRYKDEYKWITRRGLIKIRREHSTDRKSTDQADRKTDCNQPQPLPHHHRKDVLPSGAKSHAHTELPRARCDRCCDHAGNTCECHEQRQPGEYHEQRGRQARRGQRFRPKVIEGPDLFDRLIRIDGVNCAP